MAELKRFSAGEVLVWSDKVFRDLYQNEPFLILSSSERITWTSVDVGTEITEIVYWVLNSQGKIHQMFHGSHIRPIREEK